MSNKYNNAVQRVKPLSGHATRLVLWFLADHANDQGYSYASYETLMSRCAISGRDTVARALKELVSLGIIVKEKRFNNCNKYRLVMEAIVEHSLTVKLEEVDGDSGVSQGSDTLRGGSTDSLTVKPSEFDDHTDNSLMSGGHSLITQTLSLCLPIGKNSIYIPTVSGADAPSYVSDSISPTKSTTRSTPKSKAKTTPHTSGTAVPEPQPGTSRPETHGGFVSQERPRVPPPPAETLEQVIARNNVGIAAMEAKRAKYYAEGGDDL